MITSPLRPSLAAGPRVRHALGRQVGAPAAPVGALAAGAAGPGAAEDLVAAVLQRAAVLGGLALGEGPVGAGRLEAGREVDEGRGAVVPGYGRVGAGVDAGVAVAHFYLSSLFSP
jgi:hypothetical protein